MAKFCSEDCEDTGSICDFCKHYKDEYRDILKLENKFARDGVCDITKEEVAVFDGFDCDNFECFKSE